MIIILIEVLVPLLLDTKVEKRKYLRYKYRSINEKLVPN